MDFRTVRKAGKTLIRSRSEIKVDQLDNSPSSDSPSEIAPENYPPFTHLSKGKAHKRKREQLDKAKAERQAHKLKREELARAKAERQERDAEIGEKARATVPPPAGAAHQRRRHRGILLSFVLVVLLPLGAIWWYLSARAADQYVSHVGFSVRTEDMSSAMELLGGLTSLSGGSSSDPDILYEFIQSQELVQRIDEELDLRAMYSKPENDPYFSFDTSGSIEDLTKYWSDMTRIYYDGSAGMIELRVLAFDPDDAQKIAQEIFRQSTRMINELSAIAREDATRYAREELEKAVERLKRARMAITEFRNKHQIVDPNADIQGQVGLVNTLQQQLAAALIEIDLLNLTAQSNDPRLDQANRKIEVIRARISEERKKFGEGGANDSEAFSTLISEYEGLVVDREFAEQAYVSALSAFDSAQAEAQRQSRYLAAYVQPTKAERSTYPERMNIMILAAIFIFLSWATAVLLAYALKDRR